MGKGSRVLCIPLGLVIGVLVSTAGAQPDDVVPSYRPFVRGDINIDAAVGLADAIGLLDYLFTPGSNTLPCLDAGDVNDDEQLGLTDAIDLLGYLFGNGAIPAEPFGTCGPDPTLNVAISCEVYDPCAELPDLDQVAHVMRRAGFGPTPTGIDTILQTGIPAYLDSQLQPELIDESGNQILNQLLAGITPESDLLGLVWLQVIRALYSERQLHEALTEFWENHFNTQIQKVLDLIDSIETNAGPLYTPEEALAEAVLWEYQENQLLRDNALGSFLDLLLANATGKPMLVYLDGIFNIVGSPNENYSRELMELHTMGVDNGYTQEDIEEVARCFTGWTICKTDPLEADDPHGTCLPFDTVDAVWTFHFHPPFHDYATKVLFENTSYELVIPPRPLGSEDGILDGLELLEHLSTLPQTAEFVSTKLVRRLVDDEAPPALIADCVSTWLTTDGDIREVVSTIVHSDEFLGSQHRWTKVATPFEFLIAQPRGLGALTTGLPVIFGAEGNQFTGLIGLDYIPFFYVTPDGRSEFGFDWIASTHLLNRILYGTLTAQAMADPLFDPLTAMDDAGVTPGNVEEIVDFWLQRMYQNYYTVDERQLVIDFLSTDVNGSPSPLNALAPDYEERVRACIGFILSAPQAQKQ